MNLSGKTILVIGAAGKIGLELIKQALDQGARVVAADQDDKLLAKKTENIKSDQLLCQKTDITDATSVVETIERCISYFGSLDGAVNAAYPRNAEYGRTLFDVSFSSFSDNISLHIGGYFIVMQKLAEWARYNEKDFSLVNISSIYGSINPRFGLYDNTDMTSPIEYTASKAGIEHMTRYVSAYTKGTSFRVNCVSPGGIDAEQPPAFKSAYKNECRKKGMLDPTDVSGTIIFLLSENAYYITGQNLIVDDGFSQ